MTNREPSDERLDQILAEILASQSRGDHSDPETIIQANPEYADEIRQFLSNQKHFAVDGTTNAFTSIDPKRSPRIGNFKLLQRLGEGGMGEVWMADQEKPVRRRVAIKLVKPGMDSRAVLARFDAERQALALMNHPNIAKVFEAGIVGENDQGVGAGRPYFVMELVKGIPITNFCDERRLPIQERLELFRQSCSAVHHAHQKGIIHRDLKPSNILVESHDDRPVLKVIDFGLAKAIGGTQLTEQTLFTALGAIAGTPMYMAPEQAVLNAIDIDIRADVYSLGVLLYELLTGTTPLTKDTMHKKGVDELMKLIRDYEPPKPSIRLSASEALPSIAAMRQVEPLRLGRFVKGELDWIVMKALSKERERRYSSAMAFSEDIFRFLNQEAVEASPPSTTYMLRKFAARNRGIVLAASAVTGALGLGLVGTTIGFLRAQHIATLESKAKQESIDARDQAVAARNAAELEAYIANISLIQSAIANNDYETAKKRLAVCPVNLRGFEWHLLDRQAQFVVGVLPESPEVDDGETSDKYSYRYNDDESMVLVYLDQNTLQVYDLRGNPIGESMVHPSAINHSFFSRDNHGVITACRDGNIRCWNIRSTSNISKVVRTQGSDEQAIGLLSAPDRFISYDPSQDKQFKIWNYGGDRVESEFLKSNPSLSFREAGPEGTILASHDDKSLYLLDANGERLETLNPYNQNDGNFAANGAFVVIRDDFYRNTSSIWNKAHGFVGQLQDASSILAISRSGALIASGDGIWHKNKDGAGFSLVFSETGRAPRACVDENQTQVAFVSDSKYHSSTISIWDESGKLVKESLPFYCVHVNGYPYGPDKFVKFCHRDSRLATHCNDQHFKILDRKTLKPICFAARGNLPSSDFDSKPLFPVLAQDEKFGARRNELAIWSEDGVQIGHATISSNDAKQLHQSKVIIIDNLIADLSKFDNGVSTLDSGVTGNLEAESLLESCENTVDATTKSANPVSIQVSANQVTLLRDSAHFGLISTTVAKPLAILVEHGRSARLIVADGKNIRFFDTDSLREIASFRQKQPVTELIASNDGACVAIAFKDGTRIAWDLRSLAQKQSYWKDCASEFQPSTEYVERLLLTDTPTDQLMQSCLNDRSLSARRKWGVARLIEEAVDLDELLGTELCDSLLEACFYSKELMFSKINQMSPTTVEARRIEHAKRNMSKLKIVASDVYRSCRPILFLQNQTNTDCERAMTASKEAYAASSTDKYALAAMGASHFRLGQFDLAIGFLKQADDLSSNDQFQSVKLFLAMCQFNLGDRTASVETMKLVKLPEDVDEWFKALFDEATSLINGN